MSTPLQPCPFCGCDDLTMVIDSWIRCIRCETLGPTKDDPEAAVTAWNTRADVGQFANIKAFCEKADRELATWAARLTASFHRTEYLEGEVTRLKRLIAQLSNTGDAVVARLGCGCGSSGQCKYCDGVENEWNEAKKATK